MHNHISFSLSSVMPYLILAISLMFSFFFSCSETTIFSLSKIQLVNLEKLNPKKYHKLAKLLENSQQTLITILLGNMVVNIVASLSSGVILESIFKNNPILSFIIGILVATFLILVIGEITPKSLAIYKADKIVFFLITPITLVVSILTPFQRILGYITGLFLKRFKITQEEENTELVNEEELKNLISMGEESGVIKEDESSMIHSIFDFGDTTVDQIMTLRSEILAVSINLPKEEIIEIIKKIPHRRILVFDKDIDEVLGVLHIKDLILRPEKKIFDLLHKVLFVPPKKLLDDLLNEFQKSKCQVAIVLDEMGGTAGIITMHDLLEEIFGKIRDVEDQDDIQDLKNDRYVINGSTELEELGKKLNIDFPHDLGRTISGFLMNKLGKIPTIDEIIEYEGYNFFVNKMERHRITQVLIEKIHSNSEK